MPDDLHDQPNIDTHAGQQGHCAMPSLMTEPDLRVVNTCLIHEITERLLIVVGFYRPAIGPVEYEPVGVGL
ncbi:hypothetical protein WM015_08805 [Bifidobacterium mongoliense]